MERVWLRAQILTWRWGWGWWLVLGMALQALLLAVWLVPSGEARLATQRTEIAALRQQLNLPAAPTRPELNQAIAKAREPLEWWRRVRLLTQAQDLRMSTAEFAHAREPGSVARMDIALPLQGGYPGVRGLVTELLLDAPSLALETIEISSADSPGEVKATLNLSYLHPASTRPMPQGHREHP